MGVWNADYRDVAKSIIVFHARFGPPPDRLNSGMTYRAKRSIECFQFSGAAHSVDKISRPPSPPVSHSNPLSHSIQPSGSVIIQPLSRAMAGMSRRALGS